jgi:hypothetical protein
MTGKFLPFILLDSASYDQSSFKALIFRRLRGIPFHLFHPHILPPCLSTQMLMFNIFSLFTRFIHACYVVFSAMSVPSARSQAASSLKRMKLLRMSMGLSAS